MFRLDEISEQYFLSNEKIGWKWMPYFIYRNDKSFVDF